MSVVVRGRNSGKLYVYAKGAETQIIDRLAPTASPESKQQVQNEVYRLGSMGLRTLVFAMREMSEEEYQSIEWSDDAFFLSEKCEKDFILLGCTGVEDELQDDVASTIQDFRAAGIKVWMLTGDLGHTAQEIGYNCGVMSRQSNQARLFKLETIESAEISELAKQIKECIKAKR